MFQYQKRYVDLRISNNSLNKLLRAVFLSDSSQNTAHNNLFEELFRGITLDDVFDDVTSTKTRNKVQVIKIADTLLHTTTHIICTHYSTAHAAAFHGYMLD